MSFVYSIFVIKEFKDEDSEGYDVFFLFFFIDNDDFFLESSLDEDESMEKKVFDEKVVVKKKIYD